MIYILIKEAKVKESTTNIEINTEFQIKLLNLIFFDKITL